MHPACCLQRLRSNPSGLPATGPPDLCAPRSSLQASCPATARHCCSALPCLRRCSRCGSAAASRFGTSAVGRTNPAGLGVLHMCPVQHLASCSSHQLLALPTPVRCSTLRLGGWPCAEAAALLHRHNRRGGLGHQRAGKPLPLHCTVSARCWPHVHSGVPPFRSERRVLTFSHGLSCMLQAARQEPLLSISVHGAARHTGARGAAVLCWQGRETSNVSPSPAFSPGFCITGGAELRADPHGAAVYLRTLIYGLLLNPDRPCFQ